jgi:hypothetical protein
MRLLAFSNSYRTQCWWVGARPLCERSTACRSTTITCSAFSMLGWTSTTPTARAGWSPGRHAACRAEAVRPVHGARGLVPPPPIARACRPEWRGPAPERGRDGRPYPAARPPPAGLGQTDRAAAGDQLPPLSVMACALLRRAGRPVRARCGHATYLGDPGFADQWIIEVWDGRWVRVDPDLSTRQRDCDFSFDDIPPGKFLADGEAWREPGPIHSGLAWARGAAPGW